MNRKHPIQIVRRNNPPLKTKLIMYAIALTISLGAAALILTVLNVDAGKYFTNMLTIGLLDTVYPDSNIESFIEILIPLMLVSLGLALAFRIKFWNIGGEGQFIFGAIAGYLTAYFLPKLGTSDAFVTAIAAALIGGLAGALYGLIPGLLKIRFGTNETLLTLMLNYIALYFLEFLGNTANSEGFTNIFLDPTIPRTQFLAIELPQRMPRIAIGKFDLNISLIVTAALFVVFIIYLKSSKHGYEMSVVGDSENTARYAGINVKKVTVRTVFLSAFLVGMAGAFCFCSCGQLSTNITKNVGFTGIVVAWLAKLSPVMIFVVSLLICVLQYGSMNAGTDFSNIDRNFADMLQGIILFTVLACEFFIRFKVIIHLPKKSNAETGGAN